MSKLAHSNQETMDEIESGMSGSEVTYCEDCVFLHEETRGKDPRWQLCTRHPNMMEGFGFVSHTKWDKAEPFLRCRDVNGGACPLYEERKEDAEIP